jgi:AcrR family transcriptional regulator
MGDGIPRVRPGARAGSIQSVTSPGRGANRRGRPRDGRIERTVLDAAVALLAEKGYAATTIRAISLRAGVPAPAIYRRWASRVELIESAIAPADDASRPEVSGDLLTDVQAYVDTYQQMYATPAAQAAFIGLLNEYQHDPESNRTVSLRLGQHIRSGFHELLAAQPPGAIPPDVDADALLDMLIGAVVFRTFLLPFTGRRAGADHIAATIVRSLSGKPDNPAFGVEAH